MRSKLNIGVSGRQSADEPGENVLFFGINRRIHVAIRRQIVAFNPLSSRGAARPAPRRAEWPDGLPVGVRDVLGPCRRGAGRRIDRGCMAGPPTALYANGGPKRATARSGLPELPRGLAAAPEPFE